VVNTPLARDIEKVCRDARRARACLKNTGTDTARGAIKPAMEALNFARPMSAMHPCAGRLMRSLMRAGETLTTRRIRAID